MFGTMRTILVHILLCVYFNDRFVGAQISSPCPEIFSYKYDYAKQEWYGEIHTHPPHGLFRIDLTLIATTAIPNDHSGSIMLAHYSNKEVFKRLKNGQELMFLVKFPFQNPLPVLTSIRFNNKLVCSSGASILSGAEEGTTINLQFTLQAEEAKIIKG